MRLEVVEEILGFGVLGLQEIGADQEFRLRDLIDEAFWEKTEVEERRVAGKRFKAMMEQYTSVEIVRTDSANHHHYRKV